MRIGIIGTGNMGRALGLRWARAGHEVLFGSRDVKKAKAVAADGSASTQAGDFHAAAAFGEVVLYTVRDYFPSRLIKVPHALSGKIVIDCNNSAILGLDIPDPENRPGIHFTTPVPSHAEELAADTPGARVVKAFNTMASQVIELDRDQLTRRHVSVFLCSDDEQAKLVVKGLAEELGFVGIDCGALERAQLVEPVGDFIRFQIIGMSLGPFATISLDVAPAR
ncbi:MAG: F420-dependent NADP oxidoreductase [Verrucomicrobia bacterium]|nr:MAG: F420-dependent NADP oxidoreductase [Verrucomicrobiota bacterium]